MNMWEVTLELDSLKYRGIFGGNFLPLDGRITGIEFIDSSKLFLTVEYKKYSTIVLMEQVNV